MYLAIWALRISLKFTTGVKYQLLTRSETQKSQSPLCRPIYNLQGAKGDWDFRISDLVKRPCGEFQ